MSLKDRLQIILITYNRAKFVKKTFDRFFYEGSPVYDYNFLVLDNNSTDNTAEVVAEFMKTHPNVSYSKNHYNLGISGNIAKAMEVANKDYVWIIGDDDKFDFSNWGEVEQAINNNEKMICVARYAVPNEYKDDPAYQLLQLTFITGGIYSTSLFNDTTMRNAFDTIFTLFPHLPPILQFINDGGKIYVVNEAISDNGMNEEQKDCSYIRGIEANELYTRTSTMSWIVGYCNICSLLKDKKLKYHTINTAIQSKDIHNGDAGFYKAMRELYGGNPDRLMQLIDVYMNVDEEHREQLKALIQNCFAKSLWRQFKEIFFKIKKGKEYHTVRILFFKFKRKRH